MVHVRLRRAALFCTALGLVVVVWYWGSSSSPLPIRIATFNVWNAMFNWPLRCEFIGRELLGADVVALQEVPGQAALDELRGWMGSDVYRWSYYDDSASVALVSRLPLDNVAATRLSFHASDPDKNRRVLLSADVDTGTGGTLRVLAVHMSYDRTVQVRHMAEVRSVVERSLREDEVGAVVLLGDLNIYRDHDGPLRSLLQVATADWTAIDLRSNGQENDDDTFSNMPTPGLESRPDRILLFSNSRTGMIQRAIAHTVTDSSDRYRALFSEAVLARRLAIAARNDLPCEFDCGPRAVCQCGLCVLDTLPCPSPCDLCSSGDPAELAKIVSDRVMPEEFHASDHRLVYADLLLR